MLKKRPSWTACQAQKRKKVFTPWIPKAALASTDRQRTRPERFSDAAQVLDMLNNHAVAGRVAEAEQALRAWDHILMNRKVVRRTAYNTLIKACKSSGDFKKAEQIYQEMGRKGIEITQRAFFKLFETCVKEGDMNQAERLLEGYYESCREMHNKEGLGSVTHEAYRFMITKAQNFEDAEMLFQRAVRRGAIPVKAMIEIAAKLHNLKAVETWYERAVTSGIELESAAFARIINYLLDAGDVEAANQWYLRASERGSDLRPKTLERLAAAQPHPNKSQDKLLASRGSTSKSAAGKMHSVQRQHALQ